MAKKIDIQWECVYNHLPKWMIELEEALSACMSDEDMDKASVLLDRYNTLTIKEKNKNEDAFSLYGVEAEKEEIINQIIKIEEKYRAEAEELITKIP